MSYLIFLTTLLMMLSVIMIGIALLRILLGDSRMIRAELTMIKYFGPTLVLTLIALTLMI